MDGMGLMSLVFGLSDEARKAEAAKKPAKKKKDKFAFLKTLMYAIYFFFASILVLWKHLQAFLCDQACSQLKGPLGSEKCLHMIGEGKAPKLKEVKDAGKRLGNFTLNDVFLAAFTGALGKWIKQNGGEVDTVTCALPVNLRAAGEEYIGNKIGAFTVKLPVGISDPSERLKLVAKRMKAAKNSTEAPLGFYTGKLALFIPTWASSALMAKLTSGIECVFTNIMGPPEQLHLAGREVNNFFGFVPPPPGVGLGVAVASYGGNMQYSVSVDKTLLGDTAKDISSLFDDELKLYMKS